VNPVTPTRTSGAAVALAISSPAGDRVDLPPLPPELFINRELSWLEFNRRVLEEAQDPQLPLLERVKFAAIFASNLDEFFMIRVANLRRKLAAGLSDPGPDGRTPMALATILRSSVQTMLDDHARLFCDELVPELAAAGVQMIALADLDAEAAARLNDFFERDIFPVLTPQAIDRARRFPHVSNQSLNLLVVLQAPDTGVRYARVKVPAILSRVIPIPEDGATRDFQRFVWLEELVAARLERLFPGHEVVTSYPFHLSRDADIELDDEEGETRDLIVEMEKHLSQRTFGAVVQLLVDRTMPKDVRTWLMDQLHATERDLYIVDGPLALEGLFDLAKIERPDLKHPPLIPAPLFRLADPEAEPTAWGSADIFATIRNHDIMIHHPYQSFGVVTDFLQAAARDSNVVAIKQTLYRIGRDSPLIPSLIEARDEDTQVAVLMEVKARFDEENNILWAHELEEHGVHVAYGLAGLKTHCKVTLVVRRDPDRVRRYIHLSTGNYNASTARMYEDIGILTAREEIGSDVTELFNVLTGYSKQDRYRKIWVAPMHLREQFLSIIAREIATHRETGGGRLIFKMNSLVDRDIIRMLYAASQAGVKIDLIIRGICCLRPGVTGWSENIRVRSIVGRFLEHSRIYYFGNGGADEIYLGSADLMERNLDRRVEVVFPVEDEELKARLRDILLPAYFRDTVNARELKPDGLYARVESKDGEAPFDVQRWLIDHYRLA